MTKIWGISLGGWYYTPDQLSGIRGQELLDDPRILHLAFRELAADLLATVRKVRGWAGLEAKPQFSERVQAWLDAPENRVDHYGRYPYSYEALGLSREWVETLFADYSQRFGL